MPEKTSQSERRFSVNEIFGPTMQGEGALIGALTHFVRFNGCDYRCAWCDSPEAVLPELIKNHHTPMTAKEISDKLLTFSKACWVTLSGGNPGMHEHLRELIGRLRCNWKVACETQGTIYQDWFEELDHLVVSPKPPSANQGAPNYHTLAKIFTGALSKKTSVKIVVFDAVDLGWALEQGHILCGDVRPLYLQVGTDPTDSNEEILNSYRELVEQVHHHPAAIHLDVRVLPQTHKLLYGHGRGV
jgi:7-carboxy-7-deazaguanine synthase